MLQQFADQSVLAIHGTAAYVCTSAESISESKLLHIVMVKVSRRVCLL